MYFSISYLSLNIFYSIFGTFKCRLSFSAIAFSILQPINSSLKFPLVGYRIPPPGTVLALSVFPVSFSGPEKGMSFCSVATVCPHFLCLSMLMEVGGERKVFSSPPKGFPAMDLHLLRCNKWRCCGQSLYGQSSKGTVFKC